jgi:chitinase
MKGSFKPFSLMLLIGFIAALLLATLNSAAVNAATASNSPDQTDTTLTNRINPEFEKDQKQVVGYFIEWGVYGRQYFVKNIVSSGSAAKLTTLNYAFGNVTNNQCALADTYADYDKFFDATQSVNGTADSWDATALRGNFHQLQELKKLYPNIKVVISLGGYTLSSGFSSAAQPANVSSFVSSCISTFLTDPRWAGVFDGFDIDWEYPDACGMQCGVPADTQNFTGMLAEFRRQLDLLRPGLLLTIAAPAGQDKYSKIELGKIQRYLNWMDVMTYDYHGTWENTSNFNAPLFDSKSNPAHGQGLDINDTINGYLKAGVPPHKLVLGVPFYGRGWAGVPNINGGLYQTSTGPAAGTYEQGIDDYHVLKGLEATYQKHWDRASQALWLYNPTTGIFWSYENPFSVANKGRYISTKAGGLGGGMFWELSGDDAQGSLITALYQSVHHHYQDADNQNDN